MEGDRHVDSDGVYEICIRGARRVFSSEQARTVVVQPVKATAGEEDN